MCVTPIWIFGAKGCGLCFSRQVQLKRGCNHRLLKKVNQKDAYFSPGSDLRSESMTGSGCTCGRKEAGAWPRNSLTSTSNRKLVNPPHPQPLLRVPRGSSSLLKVIYAPHSKEQWPHSPETDVQNVSVVFSTCREGLSHSGLKFMVSISYGCY